MNKHDYAFGRLNYLLLIAGIIVIIAGFFMMAGSGTTEEQFNPEIFGNMRIKAAPLVSLFGFIVVIAAILVRPRRKPADDEMTEYNK